MRLLFRCLLTLAIAMMAAVPGRAENAPPADSPLGRWKTVDDLTGKVKSVVLIWEQDGKLFGKVQNLVNPDPKNPNPSCNGCSGAQKGKPVVGLQIMQNLRKGKDGWSGGTILDPATGKTYSCLLSVMDGGAKLKVRGFIGFSLLGRTQYWLRD